LECLEMALASNEEWGVWGGVIFWDGVPFHRRRGRGRPRNDEPALPVEADRAELWRMVASA
ncbi:MAG: WhiB family transcriptional regulator, partial [Acidimicrobiia bacterium]|nr:WhiB family transcriptional regulator [Acidimicrobiia bacterium]